MNKILDEFHERIVGIAKKLAVAKSLLFITGAGISAESGLPTYRGFGGIYNDKATDDGIPIETVLSGEMLKKNPHVTWKYLLQIEARLRSADYNKGHHIISLCQGYFERVWVLTQNIDGFHHAAGSKNIIDIHGDMHRLICTRCNWSTHVKDLHALTIPPQCPECSAIARPDVVFFGEALSQNKLAVMYDQLEKGFDVYFSIGTTSVFSYIQEPVLDAKARGLFTVEINPAETSISHLIDARLPMAAGMALETIWNAYLEEVSSVKHQRIKIDS